MPETQTSYTPRQKLSTHANVKFGKLTLQRGPNNKDLSDVHRSSGLDSKRSKNSRNISPGNLHGSKKGTGSHLYKKFMTPKIKNSSDIKRSSQGNFTVAVNEKQR